MTKRRIITGVLAFVMLACGGGQVIKRTWQEDSRGNRICDIVVRPDDQDSAPFTLEDQPEAVCKRCGPGATWPDCNE